VEVDSRGGFECVFDAELVGLFITLSTWGTHGWTFACVEHTELDSGGVSVESHSSAEGVYFPDHMSFGKPTDGGVAGHGSYSIKVLGQDGNVTAESGSGQSSFYSGVAGTDDEDVVFFWVNEHGGSDEVGKWGSQEVWKPRTRERDVPRGTLKRRCAEDIGGCGDAMGLREGGGGVKVGCYEKHCNCD